MKKTTVLIIFLSLYALQLNSQNINSKNKIQKRNAIELMHFDNQTLVANEFIDKYYEELGLESAKDLSAYNRIQSLNGWTRIRHKQFYKGLRVAGAEYILHEKDNLIKKSTGVLLPYINLNTTPKIETGEAILEATKYANSLILSKTEGKAIVLPEWDIEEAELVIIDRAYPNFSGEYVLAYHMIISNLKITDQYRQSIYVDATDSSIVKVIDKIAHINVEGIAQTNYYGEQTIITDSIRSNLFVLRDYTRGDGVVTLNSSAEDFEDDDNYWDNVGNEKEFATDAHYCASAFYDYMLENYNWRGLDNNGFELRSIVFGSEDNRVNAFWNGSFATFYGGNCNEYDPLTTFGVVGHEFAHAFTEFTSGLIYAGESGALNESISDILGKALEFTYDSENKSWLIGHRFLLSDTAEPFRDMSNPNSLQDPKLYGGEFWDYGGVHTQSGVMNFWFHILSDGKVGVNELGIPYNVKEIGFEKAAAIVFTMNVAYLTESSTYIEAVSASVEAVKDLYGNSSQEMQSVLEAWKAVGLFLHSKNYDLAIKTSEEHIILCGSGPQEHKVDVVITNVGLNRFSTGDLLTLKYQYKNELSTEEITLKQNLLPGDSLQFSFEKPLIVYEEEIYPTSLEVNLEAISHDDPNSQYGEIIRGNNRHFTQVSALITEGKDIQLLDVEINSETSCSLSSTSNDFIRIRFRNASCDTIFANTYTYSILFNGEEYFYEADFPTLRPRFNTRITRPLELPEGLRKGDDIIVTMYVDDDINKENNRLEKQFERKAISINEAEDFSIPYINLLEKVVVEPHYGSDAKIGVFEGNEMLIISGDTLSENRPTPFLSNSCPEVDVFFGGYIHRTEISACIDTRGSQNQYLALR